MKPEDMEQAIIRNLEAKTGKPLEAWFEILRASQQTSKADLKDELKTVHGVGHFQAQTIVKHYLLQ